MVEVVQKYGFQTDEIAPELQATTLAQTIANIHWFLFNHFQYKADDDEQQLRSPACSWAVREVGIDCKSYSILASSICNSLNIKNIIRKVNYTTTPNAYSHVYVIVPIDQTNNNPANGYFIIDGTLENNEELPFVTYKDQPMQHTTLNSPYNQPQLNGGFDDWLSNAAAGNNQTVNAIQNGISTVQNASSTLDGAIDLIPYASTTKAMLSKFLKIDLSNISEAFKHLDCIGGSAYENKDADADITIFLNFMQNKLMAINTAILQRDMNALSIAWNEHSAFTYLIRWVIRLRIDEKWNSCSTKNLEKVAAVYDSYRFNFHDTILNEYRLAFFDTTREADTTISSYRMAEIGCSTGLACQSGVQRTEIIEKYTFRIKDGITTIPALEYTPEIQKAISGNATTTQKAIDSFTKVIQVVKPIVVAVQNGGLEALANNPYPATTTNTPANNGTPSNSNAPANSNTATNTNTPNPAPETQKAGFPIWAMVLLGGIAVSAATMKLKN